MGTPPDRSPSMQEVASRAGVHQTTVSRALRNDPRLPLPTRQRLRRIADEMGYRPHPLVSALVAMRRARLPVRLHSTLAFVLRNTADMGHACRHYLAGAKSGAEQLGYKVEVFRIGAGALTEKRLDEVLKARGIHGIIIAPLPEAQGHFTLDWPQLCTVAIESTFTTPSFDRVLHDSYAGMRRIMQECRRRGWRRCSLVMSVTGHERTERKNHAAVLVEQAADDFFAPIPALIMPHWKASDFSAWHDLHLPEVIITSNDYLGQIESWCKQRRVKAGRDIQIINMNAIRTASVSGISQDPEAIGTMAVRMLIDKCVRNERGTPVISHTMLTPGHWQEGTTLQQAPELKPRT